MKRSYKRVIRRQAFRDCNRYLAEQHEAQQREIDELWDKYRTYPGNDYEQMIGE